MAGREDSVKAEFDSLFISACTHYNSVDVRAPLNGLDQFFNADTMFSTFDKFFIIEFKSQRSSLKAENNKPSACDICCGLRVDQHIIPLHDECHFAMWGKMEQGILQGYFDIYRFCVCSRAILPDCNGAKYWNLFPEPYHFKLLAQKAGLNNAGLNADDFLIYLEWLLGSRGVGRTGSGDFNATIYATSSTHGIAGMPFKSIENLRSWSKGVRPEKRNDGWDGPSF